MLKASLAATILTATMAIAQTSQESWKGDLTGVWQGPYTGDLTRNTSAKLTPWGEEQFKKFDGTSDPCLPVGVSPEVRSAQGNAAVLFPDVPGAQRSHGVSGRRTVSCTPR
jgi:hypothetical protein